MIRILAGLVAVVGGVLRLLGIRRAGPLDPPDEVHRDEDDDDKRNIYPFY